ncbi:MAG: hypothetical protein HY313_01505 [Acidobacteria bacterium]|nr:hypothetical protein [Acidobacteriota bacterium]
MTPPPPPPPPPAAPSVSLTVEPNNIRRGESATLRWSSQNATELSLEPALDQVQSEGSRAVSPSESTTYTLTARGPGGSAEATARLTVTIPPPEAALPVPAPLAPDLSLQELFDRGIRHAFFDFDKADIRSDAREALTISKQLFWRLVLARSHIE